VRGRDYELGSSVSLTAAPTAVTDQPDWLTIPAGTTHELAMCDDEVGRTRVVSPTRPRRAAVLFDGAPVNDLLQIRELLVRFQVREAGSARGPCAGSRSSVALTATSSGRSAGARRSSPPPIAGPASAAGAPRAARIRRAGWRSDSSPAITAVLPCRSGQGSAQPGRTRALTARHLEDERAGKGRRRTILTRLQLNAPARVTARLVRGRRQVASRPCRLAAGSPLVRLRVPARSRPAVYRLRLTVSAGGQTTTIARRGRLQR
jgi:hypothetical protein